VPAHEGRRRGRLGVVGVGGRRPRHLEQLPSQRQILLAPVVGQQSVVSDAVQSGGQHVQQEAADELAGGRGHGLVAGAALGPVIPSPEGHAAVVEADQAPIGDGDPVRVAR